MSVCHVLCTGIQGISALLLGVHLPKYVCLPSFVYWYLRHLCSINGDSICQIMFICHTLCTSIQDISALLLGGPSAKVCLSAKFGAMVFKASILDSLGGPSAKVGSYANFCVLVFKASMLYYLGV